jgi:hypothetical protein
MTLLLFAVGGGPQTEPSFPLLPGNKAVNDTIVRMPKGDNFWSLRGLGQNFVPSSALGH